MNMLELRREQSDFAQIVLDTPPAQSLPMPRIAARPGADPHARVNVYRNNTYASLTATLLAVFPVTTRLVDERYMRYACHRFIESCPPREPRLSQFSAGFPSFLKGFEQLASMGFVAETARLEWAIAKALDQADLIRMPISALHWFDKPEQACVMLQPSLHLVSSRWPVFTIWTSHQASAEPDLGFVEHGAVERLALWRSGANIRLACLDASRLAFLKTLMKGHSLEVAAARALKRDRLFDLATALAQLFGDGLVVGVTRSHY